MRCDMAPQALFGAAARAVAVAVAVAAALPMRVRMPRSRRRARRLAVSCGSSRPDRSCRTSRCGRSRRPNRPRRRTHSLRKRTRQEGLQQVFSSEQISSSSGASPSRAGQSSDVAFYARRRRTRSKPVAVNWRSAIRPLDLSTFRPSTIDHRPSTIDHRASGSGLRAPGSGHRAFCRLAT
ncbi:hypothetical protein BMAJHU_D0394 [Burkholderia mallei JHU]|nr:hypothetical protein BMAFMH_A0400 [Burkholderia mallei FMH]EDK57914.1 hypothetical protein BMAJHU_D0394 [Burkholderia mallei JHU]